MLPETKSTTPIGIKLATLQSSGVLDPRGTRQMSASQPLGSLLAGINGETEGTEITAAPENSETDGQGATETDAAASDTQSESAGKWGIVLALCFALPVAGVGGLIVWKKVGIHKKRLSVRKPLE